MLSPVWAGSALDLEHCIGFSLGYPISETFLFIRDKVLWSPLTPFPLKVVTPLPESAPTRVSLCLVSLYLGGLGSFTKVYALKVRNQPFTGKVT